MTRFSGAFRSILRGVSFPWIFLFLVPFGLSLPSDLQGCILPDYSGTHLQKTVGFIWLYLNRYQFFGVDNFIILCRIFRAYDLIKKKSFFAGIDLVNAFKIYRAIVFRIVSMPRLYRAKNPPISSGF